MGSVDDLVADYDEEVIYGGYEDKETWRAKVSSSPPPPVTPCVSWLMVCMLELPANAAAEVELVCASRRAAQCLDMCSGPLTRSSLPSDKRRLLMMPPKQGVLWDAGYGGSMPPVTSCRHNLTITSVLQRVGLRCACVLTTIGTWKPLMEDAAAMINVGELFIEKIMAG